MTAALAPAPMAAATDTTTQCGTFRAMASPWEVHVAGATGDQVARATAVAQAEVDRIERKYSRYRPEGVVHQVNVADGRPVRVDAETARLIDYAHALWQSSDGRFDITTGALRRAWRFDGSDRVPSQADVLALLPFVGWSRIDWDGSTIRVPAGMEIDLGGIGKEYAVDRALALASAEVGRPMLVNGGGDLAANAPPSSDRPWHVGIEMPAGSTAPAIRLFRGGLATSGDANRFLVRNGVRFGHVLDPTTGWPVADAPRAVTVLADTCSEAGAHSTIALLKGRDAERYLADAGVRYRVER